VHYRLQALKENGDDDCADCERHHRRQRVSNLRGFVIFPFLAFLGGNHLCLDFHRSDTALDHAQFFGGAFEGSMMSRPFP